MRNETDLVNRNYVSQANSKVVSDDLVESDLGLLNSVISKNNAHCVLAFLSLHRIYVNMTSC